MKRLITVFSTIVMCFMLTAVSFAESEESTAGWDLSVPTELTQEVLDVFQQATKDITDVSYEPVAHLGTMKPDGEDGVVYCLLCRATPVSGKVETELSEETPLPSGQKQDAKPSYTLMYLRKQEDGSVRIQNTWDIWVDAHALPEEQKPQSDAKEEWPQNYYFSSGAGGWGTEVFMKDDWSFTGKFHDSDMGTTGEGYPYGTVYYCNFAGKFSEPELIGTNTYRMHLDQIEQEGTKDDEHIEDEIRYVCSDPYGFDDGEDFILYAPGAPVSELPEDCIMWAHWFIDPEKDDFVPEGLYLLYNENGKTAFVGMNESFQDNDS
jgi:hypothetical protein